MAVLALYLVRKIPQLGTHRMQLLVSDPLVEHLGWPGADAADVGMLQATHVCLTAPHRIGCQPRLPHYTG